MEDMMRRMQRTFGQWPATTQEAMTVGQWSPSVDISDNDKEFIVKAELPELKKEDIKVQVEEGTLCISGERKVQKEEKDVKFHRIERAYGRFERTFTLPNAADVERSARRIRTESLPFTCPRTLRRYLQRTRSRYNKAPQCANCLRFVMRGSAFTIPANPEARGPLPGGGTRCDSSTQSSNAA
jgi:HSP20 family protein